MRGPDAASARRAFSALLRFVAGGRSRVSPEGEAGLVGLLRHDGRARIFAAPLLRAARSRGLVEGGDDHVALTAAGRSALRRLLAEPETAFQAQHRQLSQRHSAHESVGAGGGRLTVNDLESPLAALARLRRKDGAPWLPDMLVAAGDRLRADFTRGQLQPGVSARWEPAIDRGGGAANGIADLSDSALAARARVEKAIAAVGPELSGLLLDVCCFLKGLETVERERQWPQRSAKLLLRAGLEMLDRHYNPPERPRRQDLRGWGGEGYRPPLGG